MSDREENLPCARSPYPHYEYTIYFAHYKIFTLYF